MLYSLLLLSEIGCKFLRAEIFMLLLFLWGTLRMKIVPYTLAVLIMWLMTFRYSLFDALPPFPRALFLNICGCYKVSYNHCKYNTLQIFVLYFRLIKLGQATSLFCGATPRLWIICWQPELYVPFVMVRSVIKLASPGRISKFPDGVKSLIGSRAR